MRYVLNATLVFLAVLLIAACDDNTSSLGIYSQTDGISNSTGVFELTTRSLKMDSVVANSTVSYLGSITDPETGADITADFAAQFYTFEDYQFPDKKLMVGESGGTTQRGIVQCDSCEVRLYFDNYYGDADNPMKLEVYELSSQPDKILSEDSVYYTNVDLTKYLASSKPLVTRMFTPRDFNVNESTLSESSYTNNVRIMLPASIGQRIMDKYYEDPDYFRNSYHFIRNVFPGLFFKTSGGRGTMLSVNVGTLNLYYRYGDVYDETQTYNGYTRFAATPEVIQSTHFDNQDVDSLLADTTCTYLKTPASICTEMTLPIDSLFAGVHATDSISLATVTLTRYNKSQQDKYQLGTPSELLMVRKQDMHSFFLNNQVADGRTSYTTSFDSSYNTYTFSNICRLIAYCKHEKMTQAAAAGLTEDQWAALHPDWNKVVLIPVVTSTNTSGVLVSVNHDLELNSIRLVGGDTKLKMQVIYSKFYQE